ncbi:hypothetical protein NL676_030623, partial [Syzygium grande]
TDRISGKELVHIKHIVLSNNKLRALHKSDPMAVVYLRKRDGMLEELGRTEVILNNLDPAWIEKISLAYYFVTVQNLVKLQKSMADLEKLHKERNGANFTFPASHHGHEKVLKSQLFVDQFCEKEQYSFLDYISSGFELNFMVAVDFTVSNGNPRNPDSLHYIDPSGRYNSYQQAIMEVGEVIQFYDLDRRFTAEGVEGIMAAFAGALHNVSLSGPTLFGSVINRAAQIPGESLYYNHNKYYALLIITDGVLTDQQETMDALVRASDLPLSVLIVGVGGGSISVVQALLEELPGQFLTYMRAREINHAHIRLLEQLFKKCRLC